MRARQVLAADPVRRHGRAVHILAEDGAERVRFVLVRVAETGEPRVEAAQQIRRHPGTDRAPAERVVRQVALLDARVGRVSVAPRDVLVGSVAIARVAPGARPAAQRRDLVLRRARAGNLRVRPMHRVVVVRPERRLEVVALAVRLGPDVERRILHDGRGDAVTRRKALVLKLFGRIGHRTDEVVLHAEVVSGFVHDRRQPRVGHELRGHRIGRAPMAGRVDDVGPVGQRKARNVGRDQDAGAKLLAGARIVERLRVRPEARH